MLFVCGDTHGGEDSDLRKLNSKNFPSRIEKKATLSFSKCENRLRPNDFDVKTYANNTIDLFLNKNSTLIILGDFGLIWSKPGDKYYKAEMNHLKNLARKGYQVCFLDGNHENHDMLNGLEIVNFKGGKAGLAYEDQFGKILHLRRGEIYNFNGKKVLTIGGASSYDAKDRINGESWWSGEELQNVDKKNTMKNLFKVDFKVDLILTHTCPSSIGKLLLSEIEVPIQKNYNSLDRDYINAIRNIERYTQKSEDKHSVFFQQLIDKYNLEFKEWHFGHFHQDKVVNNNFFLHYKSNPKEIKLEKELKFINKSLKNENHKIEDFNL